MHKDTEHSKDKHSSHLNADSIKAALSDSSDNIKHISAQLVEEFSEFLESKKEDILGMKGKCKVHIKENPFTAVLGAVAIGALLGILFKK